MNGIDYQRLRFDYARSPDEDAPQPARHPLIVVGAGPVGLTAAIDLAARGLPVVLLDDDDRLSHGSRAICFAKRTLEIWDRLGCGERMVAKGVSWNVGKVFFRDALAYRFDLLPERGHRRPAFVNLQQYYCEGYLHERAATLGKVDVRWRNRVVSLAQHDGYVELGIETPNGGYTLRGDWVLACDGARSALRRLLGQESRGRAFQDRFLIADVRMQAGFPPERWFWFDPPFHRNQSVLLHRQPDDVWRIDFQLGWDADPEQEKKPEKVIPRIRALLGSEARFELEWVSVYTFACKRMEHFRHGRVLFAGDAAHGVSPFGARGANSGVQDVDNLCWKLAMVMQASAPQRLLDSYCAEREFAADENILQSSRSTDFITPKSTASRSFRDAVLELSREHPFARRLVNSGRLSLPSILRDSPLNTPDTEGFAGLMGPGAPAADAPVRLAGRVDWLLAQLGGEFTLLVFGEPEAAAALPAEFAVSDGAAIALRVVCIVAPGSVCAAGPRAVALEDVEGLAAQRYDGRPGTAYLLRPDQHVCARWRRLDADAVRAALARATCND